MVHVEIEKSDILSRDTGFFCVLHGKRGSNTISIGLSLSALDNQPFVLSDPGFLNNILSEIRPTK